MITKPVSRLIATRARGLPAHTKASHLSKQSINSTKANKWAPLPASSRFVGGTSAMPRFLFHHSVISYSGIYILKTLV